MSFFQTLLSRNNLDKHNGQPIWKYLLNEGDFEFLFKIVGTVSLHYIDPRDITLYYAEWWKRNYNGGKPSKEEVFNSLGEDIRIKYDSEEFFQLAKKGARMLGVKWIRKQNTLYFRTLLLQGGLPLLHITNNQGKYQDFLLAVLEEQPESVEDFMFQRHIVSLLPGSSQNEIIYESCFEIVKSILNDDSTYSDLLASTEALVSISNQLKVKKGNLERRVRLSKPKNYWFFNKEKSTISLRIGLADKYDAESLSNILGFEAIEREYQFYLNEELICIFRRMINGNYKTDWYQRSNLEWDKENNLPYAYVIVGGKKQEVKDFIQTIPNLDEPGLWVKYSDQEWRFVKGKGTPDKEAAVLFPESWNTQQAPERITIYGRDLSWLIFEGETTLGFGEERIKYQSEVSSFIWTIISQKPAWMLKANMPVVQAKPAIIVYDENNKKLSEQRYKVWIRKHKTREHWQELSIFNNTIPLGCIDLKIEKEGLVAHDMFFNIGNLVTNYTHQSIDSAKMAFQNKSNFEVRLDESPILDIENQADHFTLKVKTEYSKVPVSIKGSVGLRHQRKLYFDLVSPFDGMAITDKDGTIISDHVPLSITNLYGLRVLSTPNKETTLKMRNSLKSGVVISKEITTSGHPVISFKDEIIRLFYLADVMNHMNQVCLELEEGRNKKLYKVGGFSHTLNIEDQFENRFCLNNSNDEIDLFAVPLNCPPGKVELLPMAKNGDFYEIPETELTRQFIIISPEVEGNQLMPRFVNLDPDYEKVSPVKRIENYHNLLTAASFNDEPWKELLSYFKICIKNDIPFSSFDQIRVISGSAQVAARAFFYLGINQEDPDVFIQKTIPDIEYDLGFCFHWINKTDWGNALTEINELHNNQYFEDIFSLISSYMQENRLSELLQFITGKKIEADRISNQDINALRATLGERVLNELPNNKPYIAHRYNIPVQQYSHVELLLHAPIAVAESINNIQQTRSLWGGDEFRNSIRRNIQYSQYLAPEFYKKTLLHALTNT